MRSGTGDAVLECSFILFARHYELQRQGNSNHHQELLGGSRGNPNQTSRHTRSSDLRMQTSFT